MFCLKRNSENIKLNYRSRQNGLQVGPKVAILSETVAPFAIPRMCIAFGLTFKMDSSGMSTFAVPGINFSRDVWRNLHGPEPYLRRMILYLSVYFGGACFSTRPLGKLYPGTSKIDISEESI